MKQFSCCDVVPGCSRVFREADEQQILTAVAAHAAGDHGLTVLPDGLAEQVRGAILQVA